MALSRSNLSLLYLALAPLVAHGAIAGAAAARSDAAAQQLDYKTNTVVFRQIVVSQGATRVRADHASATGLNFENSRWTFQGNVQIDAPPRGSLHSDQATVEFRDNRIAGVTITGNPAQFEQQRADDL